MFLNTQTSFFFSRIYQPPELTRQLQPSFHIFFKQPQMVSEAELIGRLRVFLRSSDLNTTTTATVRRQLENDFGIDLSDRKAFIREQVDLFLQSEHEEDGLEEQQEQEEVHVKPDDESEDEEMEDDEDSEEQKLEHPRNRKDKKRLVKKLHFFLGGVWKWSRIQICF